MVDQPVQSVLATALPLPVPLFSFLLLLVVTFLFRTVGGTLQLRIQRIPADPAWFMRWRQVLCRRPSMTVAGLPGRVSTPGSGGLTSLLLHRGVLLVSRLGGRLSDPSSRGSRRTVASPSGFLFLDFRADLYFTTKVWPKV